MHPTLAHFCKGHSQEDRLVEGMYATGETQAMTGRTSIITPDIRSRTPVGISCPHLVKLSGAVQVLDSSLKY